jgi:hypothetical protein
MGEEESVYVIGGKPEGKRPLGRLGRRRECNIKISIIENKLVYVS